MVWHPLSFSVADNSNCTTAMRRETLTSPTPGVIFSPNGAGQTALDQEKTPMTVTIRQLHPHFFGEVSGVDLRQKLTRRKRGTSRPAWTNTPCSCFATRTSRTNSNWRLR
jgi:hypothetical protein